MKKRVLIITYYWPPTTGSGVQRWLKFVKYLPDNSWQPVVYTPENPDIGLRDESLMEDIPIEAEVLKTRIFDPSAIFQLFATKKDSNDGHSRSENQSLPYRFGRWVKSRFFIPDSRILWKGKSVRFLLSYLQDHPIDVIVTTGPPHGLHLIGEELNHRTDIPWIMDLRDPMSKLVSYRQTNPGAGSIQRYEKLEARLLGHADHVIATSPGMPDNLVDFDHQKFTCITNGYDPEDFPPAHPPDTDRIVLTYAGLLNQPRNAPELWHALEVRLKADAAFYEKFEFHIAGTVSQSIFDDLRSYPKLYSKTIFHGYMEHGSVLELFLNSHMLLLLNFRDKQLNAGVIPGKLFELLAAGRQILSLASGVVDYLPLVEDVAGFHHFAYEDHNGLQAEIRRWKPGMATVETNRAMQYQRRKLTEDLVQLLNRICRTGD